MNCIAHGKVVSAMEKEKVDPDKGDQEGLIEVGWSSFIDKVRSEQKN